MRLSRVVYLVLLLGLLLAGCGGATPTPTPLPNGQATVVVQGSPSQADWLALTERLADDRSPLVQNSQLMPAPPQVMVGALPASLPFQVPLPDQAVILGSVLRQGSQRGEALILLNVPQPAASIITFYLAALAQQGFSPWMPGAVQSFQPASTARLFCQRDQGIQLELDVYDAPGQPSDVLFAEVLRAHLLAEQPAQVATLHRRASEWYERNGSVVDAIHHALVAKDFERAAELIERAVPAMSSTRQEAAVLGWLQALPDELIPFRPVLSVHYAWALLTNGELEGVDARLRDAERWLDVAGSEQTAANSEHAGRWSSSPRTTIFGAVRLPRS